MLMATGLAISLLAASWLSAVFWSEHPRKMELFYLAVVLAGVASLLWVSGRRLVSRWASDEDAQDSSGGKDD